MKIAVPTNDGVRISPHFGRCREFLIFEAQDGHVELSETRANAGCHSHSATASHHVAGHYSHSSMLDSLRDCGAVLCLGIGAGAVEALKAGGISVIMVEAAADARQIVAAYHAGTLQPATGGLCQCRH